MNATTSTVTATRANELADALFAAIVSNDIDALRGEIYAADLVIWHNNDNREQTRDENLKLLGWMVRNIESLRYEDVRRHITPTGFVQQHVLRGTARSGAAVYVPACIVVTIVEDRIVRIDEYLDSGALASFSR